MCIFNNTSSPISRNLHAFYSSFLPLSFTLSKKKRKEKKNKGFLPRMLHLAPSSLSTYLHLHRVVSRFPRKFGRAKGWLGAKEKKETGNLKGKVESLHPTMVSLPVPGHLAERRKAAVGEKKINIHGISPGKGSRAQRGAAITHYVPIVRPQMKCQRHDELTILSNSWSGADEREHEHCADSFSRACYLVVLSLSGRYVFMHINYLEPKPLIQCSSRVFRPRVIIVPFPRHYSLPSALFCSRAEQKERPLSLFRDYCISINQIICIEGGEK